MVSAISISRRAFLQTTAGGVAMLQLMLSSNFITEAVAGEVDGASNLCLIDTDIADGARRLGLAYQAVTLDDIAPMVDVLSRANARPVAVLGRFATVFAVRGLLERSARVVFEGRHRAVDGIARHTLAGFDVLTNRLARRIERLDDPLQYAMALASVGQPTLAPHAGRQTVEVDSPEWSTTDLVSLLAWPRRVS